MKKPIMVIAAIALGGAGGYFVGMPLDTTPVQVSGSLPATMLGVFLLILAGVILGEL